MRGSDAPTHSLGKHRLKNVSEAAFGPAQAFDVAREGGEPEIDELLVAGVEAAGLRVRPQQRDDAALAQTAELVPPHDAPSDARSVLVHDPLQLVHAVVFRDARRRVPRGARGLSRATGRMRTRARCVRRRSAARAR